MSNFYDLIQAPIGLSFQDIPEEVKIDEPFEVNGIKYILTKCQNKDLEVCSINDSVTSVPEPISSFYLIKRL